MSKQTIHTNNAPAAIGTYSQATRHGDTVYLSGQIPLDPQSMELVTGDIEEQVHRVFRNLSAVCEAAGGSLDQILKLTVYLTNLGDFQSVNAVMAQHFSEPFPARAAIEVSGLPKGAEVEMDAILGL